MNELVYHDEYGEDAACKFREFINNSTRHTNFTLEITDIRSVQTTFEVSENFDLVVISEEEQFKGVVSGSNNDIFIENDDYAYERACSYLVQHESTDSEIYRECRDTIAGFEFGKFYRQKGRKFLIHTNQRRVIHHFGCHVCSQSGMEPCPNCYSTGVLTCNACGGNGEISCPHCSGAGYRIEIRSHRDGDGHYRHEEVVLGCTCSNGSNQCSSCGGSGELECRSCDDGYVACSQCEATGWHSHVYEVSLLAEYTLSNSDTTNCENAKVNSLSADFLTILDYKEPLENHADLVYKETLKDQENLRIQIRRHFLTLSSMFDANLEFEGQRSESKIVFFGQQHYLLDAGCILDLVLKKDIEQLTKLTGKFSSVFDRHLEQKVLSAITDLLSSPILLKLVSFYLNDKGTSSEDLRNATSKALSAHEVGSLLKGIKRAFILMNLRRFVKILSISFTCFGLLHLLFYFHIISNDSIINTFKQATTSLPFSVTLFILLPLTVLIHIVEEICHRQWIKKTFKEKYLLVQRLDRSVFMGSFYVKLFMGSTITLFLSFYGQLCILQ